jgi:hypothetical protein
MANAVHPNQRWQNHRKQARMIAGMRQDRQTAGYGEHLPPQTKRFPFLTKYTN